MTISRWNDDGSASWINRLFKHSLVFQSFQHCERCPYRQVPITRVQLPCTCQRISPRDSSPHTFCRYLGLAPHCRGKVCIFLSNAFAQKYSSHTGNSSEYPISRWVGGMTCIFQPEAFSLELVNYTRSTVFDRLAFPSFCIFRRHLPGQQLSFAQR